MAMAGERMKGKLFFLVFASFFFVVVMSDGTKEKQLEQVIQDVKGESDKVANEIYAWIDKHSKGLRSHDHARNQSRDDHQTSGQNKIHKKEDLEKLIKTLKGESDHLANEMYAWIDKHSKGFLSRDRSRGHARDILRSRRAIKRQSYEPSSSELGGESIQQVMLDLMKAPRPKQNHHSKQKIIKRNRKIFKVKDKKFTKSAKSTKKRSSKKPYKKNKKISFQNKVKHITPSKKSKITRKEKSSFAHVIKAIKKSGGLADLLKEISADPSKKIVVTKGKNDITLDKKSLKFFNRIPKSVLKRLVEKVELNKYFNIDTYISEGKGNGVKAIKDGRKSVSKSKIGKRSKTRKKNAARKQILKKAAHKSVQNVYGKSKSMKKRGDKTGSGVIENYADYEEKTAKTKTLEDKKHPRKTVKKSKSVKKSKNYKSKLVKRKKTDEKGVSKSKIFELKKKSKKTGKILKSVKSMDGKKGGKHRSNSHIGHQKLLQLKTKIKKTNSLKFKVAKALLEHCETQNKLKKIFENVNASLKQASKLAKVIGKKFGIEKRDIDKFTTEHTEEAVQDFLNKIF